MTEDDLARLVDKLDTRQKIRLLTGATTWDTHPESAAGLAALTLSDGPAGVRGDSWDEREHLRPAALGHRARHDVGRRPRRTPRRAAGRRGEAQGRARAPRATLNLHRSPLGGRHFECFSEDPLLAGRTGAALIRGIQAHGVAATAEHYVAGDSEIQRLTVDVRVDERALREVYLAPFEAAVRAGPPGTSR